MTDVATTTPQVTLEEIAPNSATPISVPEMRRIVHDYIMNEHGLTCSHASTSSRTLSARELGGKCADFGDEIETLTRKLFVGERWETTVVGTLDSLAAHIVGRAERENRLLTKHALESYAQNVYDGERVLEEHSIGRLRSEVQALTSNHAIIGYPTFRVYLDENGFHEDHLIAANKVLMNTSHYIFDVLDVALENHEAVHEPTWAPQRRALAAFADTMYGPRRTAPMFLPTRSKVVEILDAQIDDDAMSGNEFATLKVALDSPSEHYRQPSRELSPGISMRGMDLCYVVYRHLVEHGTYLSGRNDARTNAQNLRSRLSGGPVISKSVLKDLCDHLYSSVRQELKPACRHKKRPKKFATRQDAVNFIRSKVGTDGRLPALGEFDSSEFIELEEMLGHTYAELRTFLMSEYGYKSPMSANERILDGLLPQAFDEMGVQASVEHDKVPVLEAWGSSLFRPDFLVSYIRPGNYLPGLEPKETFVVEADGEQHFVQVRNWISVEETRERDKGKCRIALEACRSGYPLRLVAFHHAMLTSLTSTQIGAAFAAATENDWGWVFIAPQGSRELRAASETTTKVTVPGLDDFDIYVIAV